MNARENYLALLNHEDTEGVPVVFVDATELGAVNEYWENGPAGGGLDGFGNGWVPTESAFGQPALDPDIIPLDDVCDWEDKVTFPDLDAIDWEEFAAEQLAMADRSQQCVEYHTWNSVFLRFTHLLGFEDALCAFYEEPEASKALCDAIADYKIALYERVAKYIKPDAIVHYDDVATERSLFMSPEIYREFIKPAHARMNEAAVSLGMIPEIHVCGKCESIIEDLIDEGSVAWQSAQPMNDLEHIIQSYGDRLSVLGGQDTQGPVGTAATATDEMIAAEMKRCVDSYGRFGRAFGIIAGVMGDLNDPEVARKNMLAVDLVRQLSGSPAPVFSA